MRDCEGWHPSKIKGGTLPRSTIDTTAAGDRNQMVVFDVDPAILSDGYPCVYLDDSGGNASNTVTILFLGEPRFRSDSMPTAIV